jgi:hypothetical protein
MRTNRLLRKPTAAAAALICLVALGTSTNADADTTATATTLNRGPLTENYDPPIYQPTDQAVYEGTPDNPLVRDWGVYQGLAEHSWLPYLAASPDQKRVLDKIVQRPKATWFGGWQPDYDITERVKKYIELSTGGDPEVMVQVSIFRMKPWEGADPICDRLPTLAEQASYKRWIDGFAAGVGNTYMAIVMQPDGPFALCAKNGSKLPSRMIKYAVQTLAALPNTSIYIDAGAADWNRDDPRRALRILIPAGIKYARGFALNSTHYDSTGRQVKYSAAVSQALAARGFAGKYGIINTSSNGRPFKGYTYNGPNFDNARPCTSRDDKRCTTLGIPPTVDVGNPKWGLSARVNQLAEKYVDGYLWFGRPWLYMQASPFVMSRALRLSRTSPY